MDKKTSWMSRILKGAEIIDALRIVPRIVLGVYIAGVAWIVSWYTQFELKYVTQCDSATLNVLMREQVPLEEAKAIACTITQVIGHPTGYTALVTVMVSAAAIVFGLYTNSGRSWEGDKSTQKSNAMSRSDYGPHAPHNAQERYDRPEPRVPHTPRGF